MDSAAIGIERENRVDRIALKSTTVILSEAKNLSAPALKPKKDSSLRSE
jgi:hypothetical protein